MKNEAPSESKERSAHRLPLGAADPVYLLFGIDGENIDPIVDELGPGGARFYTADHYHRFYLDQDLGPAVLVLPELGMPVVYPLVKWMSYPLIGVEFEGIGETDRELVFQFIFRLERRIFQVAKNGTVDDRVIDDPAS